MIYTWLFAVTIFAIAGAAVWLLRPHRPRSEPPKPGPPPQTIHAKIAAMSDQELGAELRFLDRMLLDVDRARIPADEIARHLITRSLVRAEIARRAGKP
jgi:hypothetical protein